jgi:uncharacterized protein involved in outer membrane biogenesis
MKRQTFLWLAIPAAILALLGAAILALPKLVSSSSNRSTIEALASTVTGRKVHIAGNLSLSLFPEPQLIAGNVTIDRSNGETIKARSLTLNIAMPALLRGQLTASSLMLQSPVIAFPWPLPGGPAAIAPPPWLRALHAQINHGRIIFGKLIFSDVSADIYTASGGAVSISGSGKLLNHALDVTLSLGASNLAGEAPLAVQLISGDSFAHFSGSFSSDNTVTGTLAASQSSQALLGTDPSQKLTLSAGVNATPSLIGLTGLNLSQGSGVLSGQARFDVAQSKLSLQLKGSNIVYPANLTPDQLTALPDGTIHDDIAIDKLTIGGVTLPHFDEISDLSNQGINITSSHLALAAGNTASFTGSLDQTGTIHGEGHLTADDLTALPASSAPDASTASATLTSPINGTTGHIIFGPISGVLDGSALTGNAILAMGAEPSLNSQFHIKQIDLGTLSRLFKAAAAAPHLTGNFELSAEHAGFGALTLSHLLIDGGFNDNFVIRRASASLYDGLFAGSLTMQPDGTVAAAHGFLSVPSAAALASLLPQSLMPPPALRAEPLAISLSAAGPATALATSADMSLGAFSLTMSPVIDLTKDTAAGPITLRHPSAIAAFKSFGINAGLPWPGAGSISLRADMALATSSFGLPNFVLSMGDLTANGHLSIASGASINGAIDADTLALPAIPGDLSALWKILPDLNGKIDLSADRVLLSGTQWLGAAKATLNMQPDKAALNISHAMLGGGDLQGNVILAQTLKQPPDFAANISVKNADLSTLSYPFAFPLAVTSGIATLTTNVTASGFSPQTWLATLSGPLSAHADKATLSSFNLAGLAAALKASGRSAALTQAATTGATNFATADIAGSFDHGIFKLDTAKLQGSDGAATATGSIDLSDHDVALNFSLLPNVAPPVNVGLAIIGDWTKARMVPALKSALAWKPAS